MTYNVFSGTLNPTHFTSLLLMSHVMSVDVTCDVCWCHMRCLLLSHVMSVDVTRDVCWCHM